MQTILGSGGAIGIELAKALPAYTQNIRLVSRHPEKVNATDELMQADLLNEKAVLKAVEGSSVVYLTAGLPYDKKLWKTQWPVIMSNVIAACKQHQAKLVFFDNIYMYDKNYLNGMTEETPVNSPSEKGIVRAGIAAKLMDEVSAGSLTALIARSADFYGPGIENTSLLTELVLKPMSKGKKANWLISADYKHSFTYTPDAGKATALLGNTDAAFNQVWHLPTASNPPSGKEWIEMVASEMGVKPNYRIAPRFFVQIMGWFSPVMKEIVEMLYQNDRDYVFDSRKFENHFKFKPTPYEEGIREIVKHDYASVKIRD